jgi:hypothetical protein
MSHATGPDSRVVDFFHILQLIRAWRDPVNRGVEVVADFGVREPFRMRKDRIVHGSLRAGDFRLYAAECGAGSFSDHFIIARILPRHF